MNKNIFFFLLIFQFYSCVIYYNNSKFVEGKLLSKDNKNKFLFLAYRTTNDINLPLFISYWDKKKIKNYDNFRLDIFTKCKNLRISNLTLSIKDTFGNLKFKETLNYDILFKNIKPSNGIYNFNWTIFSIKYNKNFKTSDNYDRFLSKRNELEKIILSSNDTIIIKYDYFNFDFKTDSIKANLHEVFDKGFDYWSMF